MFPVDPLSRFQEANPKYKLIKPWWAVLTGYFAIALLVIAVLAGTMQATQRNLVCVPTKNCTSFNHSLPASKTNNSCKDNKTTLLLKLPDRRLYDFVEIECGRIVFHDFVSYFPFIIFIQAIALIVVDNILLTLPEPSALVDHFLSLVIECYNTSGTSLSLWKVLWHAIIPKNTDHGHKIDKLDGDEDPEQGNHDKQPLLKKTSQSADGGSLHSLAPSPTLSEDEAIKAEALYEKVGQFQIAAEKNQHLYYIYLAQAIIQSIISCSIFAYLVHHSSTFKVNAKCTIDDTISGDYKHFKCTDFLVPFFRNLNIFSCVLSAAYCFMSVFICIWVLLFVYKKSEKYDFASERSVNEGRSNDSGNEENNRKRHEDLGLLKLLSPTDPATGNLAFLLHLLNHCNTLYLQRFSIFLSQKNEKVIKQYILMIKWPVEKLKKMTEDGGRALKLANLSGIPKTVFQMTDLDFLKLNNCHVKDDLDPNDWSKLHLRSLSLVSCGLTTIPVAILNMDSLETLDLSYNNINCIPPEIHQLTSLRALDVSHNNITEGVEHLIEMEELAELNVRENNSLDFNSLTEKPGNLKRITINEVMLKKMDEDTKSKLKDIIYTKVLSDRDVFVIKYSPERAPQHVENIRKKGEMIYKMTSHPKGVALIINISQYANMFVPDRYGSEVDVERLEKLFDGIGYQVKIIGQEIVCNKGLFREVLRTVFEEYAHGDSAILTVMSHGGEEGMYLTNGDIITVDEMVGTMQTERLQGKPKLIFLQACRGSRFMSPTRLDYNSIEDDLPTVQHPDQVDGVLARAPFDVTLREEQSDTLIAYSTLQGFASFRNTVTGSFFINALVDVFSKHAWEEDILSLLTFVNYEVSRRLSMSEYKQVPAPQTTLRKKFYFFPGYFGEDDQNQTN
ncbi:volume-regulated anion channel subunit LRRC8A [Exaiptasia diaphana]|uniref:Caspase-8 n=1 Tax=Exaiptasia diaphana TaxID=2652724 RepID=A0A913WQE9_EXADI|nr:volume-regulated anion channel subunit LRRC8A [Exaiptasia diaphana]